MILPEIIKLKEQSLILVKQVHKTRFSLIELQENIKDTKERLGC